MASKLCQLEKIPEASPAAPTNIPGLKPTSIDQGNLEEISEAGSLHDFLLKLHRQFGPVASFWWGKMFTVSISSPDLFEEQQELFDRPPKIFENMRPLLNKHCIQFANKTEGYNRRQHYYQALSDEAVNAYFPQLQEVANEVLRKWSDLVKEPEIPLTMFMATYSLKAILHALFGNLMKDENDELDFMCETDEVWAELELSLIKPRTIAREEHLKEGKKELIDMVSRMLKDRKANPPKASKSTLLDLILSYTEDEDIQLADSLEFTVAGLFGLEYFLTCAFYYIAKHSEIDKKLYEEIETELGENTLNERNTRNLVYLRHVLDETLRCCVLTAWGARYQDVDSKLGGYVIPKGIPVIQALGVALQDEKIWPDPEKFDPNRFSTENKEKRPKLSFSPFGIGKRECLAKHFPYAAASVAIVTLLRKFRVHLVDKSQVLAPAYGVITHQKEEISIRLSLR